MRLFETQLVSSKPISSRFLERGTKTFGEAISFIASCPYGRNSDRADPHLVLAEGRGSCSTKHALLALLAEELGLNVHLVLGIYEMCEENTPGIEGVLKEAGLSFVPEAHCYLRADQERIDVTRNVPSQRSPFDVLLYEETIAPAQIGNYKIQIHQDFVVKWAEERDLNPELVWQIREKCIQALQA